MLALYIACEVWDQVRLRKLKYKNKKFSFDAEYWYSNIKNMIMNIDNNGWDYSVNLCIHYEYPDTHIKISFITNGNDFYNSYNPNYLKNIKISFLSENLHGGTNSYSNTYSLENINKIIYYLV